MDQDTQKQLDDLKRQVSNLQDIVDDLSGMLNSPRVQILNLEGAMNVLSAAPTNTDVLDGSFYATTEPKLYIRINGAWKSVALA